MTKKLRRDAKQTDDGNHRVTFYAHVPTWERMQELAPLTGHASASSAAREALAAWVARKEKLLAKRARK